jgi:hypothetical protein
MGEFARWASSAKPGDKIEYCLGENVFAIANDPGRAGQDIRPLFDLVNRAEKQGAIALFQSKSFGTTAYIALKVRPWFHEKVKSISEGGSFYGK